MSARRSPLRSARLVPLGFLLLAAMAIAAPSAVAATPAPAWTVRSVAVPTNFEPGGKGAYETVLTNAGAEATNGSPIVLTDTLPAGLTVEKVELPLRSVSAEVRDYGPAACEVKSVSGHAVVSCVIFEGLKTKEPPAGVSAQSPATLDQSETRKLIVHVSVPPGASGALTNVVQVQGGGAAPASTSSENEASATPAPGGLSEFRSELTDVDGSLVTQAASHPYQYTTSFAVNTKPGAAGGSSPFVPAGGDVKEIHVTLPPGFVGNPMASALCTPEQFHSFRFIVLPGGNGVQQNECPDGSAVGFVVISQLEGVSQNVPVPLYSLVPPRGMPAQFGFEALGAPFLIDTRVRTGGDYGITAFLPNTSEVKRITAASVTLWGVSAATPSHDSLRGRCVSTLESLPFSLGSCPPGVTPKPFFRLPTSCASPLTTTMEFNSWPNPDVFAGRSAISPAPTACEPLVFTPTISSQPTTKVSDSPSGLSFNLHVPQNESPTGLSTPDLRDTVVALPKGVTVNPSSANGLQGCSPAQIELDGPEPASCPDASKVGTVEVETPLLDHPVKGAVYVATQGDNPFKSLIAIYIAVYDPETGVVIKLAGRVEPDPATGQLTTRFTDNPQLPFEDLNVSFFEGPRAPLRTPPNCGTYTTTTDMRPWSAPQSGADATPSDSFDVSGAPGGGTCAKTETQQPNGPAFQAGTLAPLAGTYSPFVLNLRREDGSQIWRGLNVALPEGLTGKLAGIPYCLAPAIAQAESRGKPGEGALERSHPSCPASSQVGTVTVAAGAGSSPIHVQGKAYLAGPYKGGPLSLVVITPAIAGPFDLGAVVVRASIRVNPDTAQVSAVSDPLPTILQGIPLDVRGISIDLDKPSFTLNPTSCEPMSVRGEEISLASQVAPLSNRFQVGGCGDLGFRPKLSLRLKGGTRRSDHPALTATVTYPKGAYANIAKAAVALPHSEFLDQAHIGTTCTRVQFAASQCPAASVYGHARAMTPLLDQPLEGPVYLRSSDNPLPDLVADLNGQIHIVLDGRIDSVHGGIRTTFEAVPDAPVSKFVLTMRGGKKGLLVNSRDICASTNRATTKFDAHNGRVADFKTVLKNSKCAKKSKHKSRG
jgi:uncharacterized repeat protein (TIGR01451 family)